MIYVPMLKGQREELKVIEEMNSCFSEKIIPLIELLTKEFEMQYAKNPKTGEYVWELHGKTRRRVKERTHEITLEGIVRRLNGKMAFVDVFRFSEEIYGKRVDIQSFDLAWQASNNISYYIEKLHEMAQYPSLIPVISIKKEFEFTENELKLLIRELQDENEAIALRFSEEYLTNCKSCMETILREGDYVLFDIGEQSPQTKFIEIQELMDIETKAKCILLNSPRKRKITNGTYPEAGLTELIEDVARSVAEDNAMYGYGDYCGLRDKLKEKNDYARGSALALLYQFEESGFYAFSNKDASVGAGGFVEVKERVLNMESILNPEGDCPALTKIKRFPKCGNPSTWINVTLTRTIHQVYKYL